MRAITGAGVVLLVAVLSLSALLPSSDEDEALRSLRSGQVSKTVRAMRGGSPLRLLRGGIES